jgi:uncharacterized protein (AIM24 family)
LQELSLILLVYSSYPSTPLSSLRTTTMRSSLIQKLSHRRASRKLNVAAASSSWNTDGKITSTSLIVVGPFADFSTGNSMNHSGYVARRSFSSQQGGLTVATTSSPSSLSSLSEKNQVATQNIRPIDFDVQSKVEGNESQIVTVTLEPNQILRAESGGTYSACNFVSLSSSRLASLLTPHMPCVVIFFFLSKNYAAMMYMTDGVEMNTTTGGGISSGFQRMMTGQNFFISDYSYKGEAGTSGTVALGTDFPSKILRLNVQEYGNGKLVCQKGALLCASHTVDIQMEFSKSFAAGFFGGEGFVLQVSGSMPYWYTIMPTNV